MAGHKLISLGGVTKMSACLIALVSVGIAPAVAADILTCTLFKTRLGAAIGSLDRSIVTRFAVSPSRDGGATGKSYEWTGDNGLAGRLTCAPGDAFADFYMARATTSEAIEDLDVFTDLGAASICALSNGIPKDCRTVATAMVGDGVDQYQEDVAHRDARPQGLQDYDLAPSLEAVFNITPRLISWAIGPGVYKSLAIERPTLKPHDRDVIE